MSDWLSCEVARFERRVRRREVCRNALLWLWPCVAIALAAYVYYRELF